MFDDSADVGAGIGRNRCVLTQGEQILLGVTKRPQLCFNGHQLLVNQLHDMGAGTLPVIAQGEDLPDVVEREANRLGLDNKAQAVLVRFAVEAIPRRRARRSRKQADLFIVADGSGVESQLLGQLTDAKLSNVSIIHGKNDTSLS